MKKILLAITLALMAVSAYSQKIAKNEVDKFTGDVTIASDFERLWGRKYGENVELQWIILNGVPNLTALYHNNYRLYSIDQGDELYINFMDGTQTMFVCAYDHIADATYYSGGSARYKLVCFYLIMPEQIEMLQKRVIKAFRLYHDGGYVEGDVNPERALIIREMFKLLDTDTMLSEEFLEITGDVEVPDVKAPETGK